jgi:hypothetical protein
LQASSTAPELRGARGRSRRIVSLAHAIKMLEWRPLTLGFLALLV